MYKVIGNRAFRNLILANRPYPQYRISIPKDWVEKLGWKPRDMLELRLVGDKIVISKRRCDNDKSVGSLRSRGR